MPSAALLVGCGPVTSWHADPDGSTPRRDALIVITGSWGRPAWRFGETLGRTGAEMGGNEERTSPAGVTARTATPCACRMPDAAMAEVRAAGWSERQCVEALGAVEIFVGFNRFLDSFQIAIDF